MFFFVLKDLPNIIPIIKKKLYILIGIRVAGDLPGGGWFVNSGRVIYILKNHYIFKK